MENKRNIFIEEVDQVLKNWTQGDYVLEGEHWFVHRYDIARPLTDVSEDTAAEEEEIDLVEEEVKGLGDFSERIYQLGEVILLQMVIREIKFGIFILRNHLSCCHTNL